MTFTTGTLTRCAGQNHYEIPITVGGVTRTLKFTAGDLDTDFADFDEAREAVLDRLRSAAKEANVANFAQAKTALEGKTFKV